MIARLCLIFACVTFASGNPAAGKTWRWKSPKPLVTPIGPVKSSRIVGGDEAVPHSWPHQVALFIDNTYFCGGSLISNEWVLTAAHCLDGASFVDVVMGAHNIETNEDTQLTLPSSDFIIHEGWNSFAYTNDIAVIRLPLAVTLNAYIGTIDLPSADVSVGTTVTATGWGRTSDSSTDTTSTLRHVEVLVISNIDCNAVFPLITGGSLCTDGSGPKGTCGGDAGGPLTHDGKIYGITSFEAAGACEGGNPDVFTRVYHYLDWIAENTGVTPPASL